MENFRFSNRFVDLTAEGNLILQRLERYEMEKNTLNLQMQYYEYLKEYLTSRNETGLIVSPSVMGVGDPMLVRLVEELSSLQLQQKQVGFVLKDELPATDLISGKVDQARNALLENVTSSISRLKISMDDVDGRIADVNCGPRRQRRWPGRSSTRPGPCNFFVLPPLPRVFPVTRPPSTISIALSRLSWRGWRGTTDSW